MTPKDFLRERLKNIFNSIKSINIKYQFNEQYDTHIVEVTPIDEFSENQDYIAMERDLLYDFNDLFFPSTLIFATENSLNKVEFAEFSFIREESKLEYSVIEYYFEKLHFINGGEAGENNFALAA